MNLRECSKLDYKSSANPPTYDDIKTGCFQRMADAMDRMATNHTMLIDERDALRRQVESMKWINIRLVNRIRSLRGVITRMKKKA